MPACSFQRSAFTPNTMSQNIRESSGCSGGGGPSPALGLGDAAQPQSTGPGDGPARGWSAARRPLLSASCLESARSLPGQWRRPAGCGQTSWPGTARPASRRPPTRSPRRPRRSHCTGPHHVLDLPCVPSSAPASGVSIASTSWSGQQRVIRGRRTYELFAATWPGRDHPWARHCRPCRVGWALAEGERQVRAVERSWPTARGGVIPSMRSRRQA